MGTRALVRVFDGDEEVICLYRQCDGYPDGLGVEVADFAAKRRIVNGISSRFDTKTIANGAGCFAALLVCEFKEGRVGSVYLYPPGTKDVGEDYEYHVKCPTVEDVRRAEEADYKGFAGLPIVVEAFDVDGGFNGTPRTLKRVPIPDDADDDAEEALTGSTDK